MKANSFKTVKNSTSDPDPQTVNLLDMKTSHCGENYYLSYKTTLVHWPRYSDTSNYPVTRCFKTTVITDLQCPCIHGGNEIDYQKHRMTPASACSHSKNRA